MSLLPEQWECWRSDKQDETDLFVQDLLKEQSEDTYTGESDDDLDEFQREEMEDDKKPRVLMEFVFSPESD